MTKEQPSPIYTEEGVPHVAPTELSMPQSRMTTQIKALMKKDFQVMQAHRRALISELVFPLLMGTLACLFLSVFLSQSGWANKGYGPSTSCSGNYYGAIAPNDFPNADMFNSTVWSNEPDEQLMQYCGSAYNSQFYNGSTWIRTMHNFDTAEEMLDGYNQYVSSLTPQPTQTSDYRLGALMYFKNHSDPYQAITVYETQVVQAWGAIPLANAIENIWNDFPTVNVKPKQTSNPQSFNIRQTFATAGSIMLSMAFLPMTSTMAGRLVDEKKAKVREHLRVMGVSSTAYLLAAFFVAMIRVGFVSISMLILIGSFNIVPVGSLMQIWLALVCYGFSLAGFAQIMPAFFSRPTVSNAAVSLFISLTGIGAVFASQIIELTPLLAFFFSPSAFIYAAAQLLNNNLAELKITPWGCIACLVWQMVFYSAVSQYLYTINPGEFGVPRPLLFPLHDLMAFIRGDNKQQSRTRKTSESSPLLQAPSNGKDRIIIENLVKVFGNEFDRPAVNKLSLRIREREIFALLGHNGAGKTTTISMLIGMLTSTSYDVAEVLGYDLNEDLDAIRQHIGICPQFDVLFDDLSARQHLDLYAAVKGRPLVDGDAVLRRLKLPLDDQKSSTFSGGMKRRLSVGNALVGDSPIIFLDEPSSGLDPVSRRQLWELLREEKNQRGKTIVLTTHFMEEADYLGDRIAIMSHGRLYCCDTSANLKGTYGVGYYLNLAKKTVGGNHHNGGQQQHNNAAPTREGEDSHAVFDKSGACEILNRYAPNWTLKQESVGDVTFLLPPSALPSFGPMLQEIEERLDQLGCSSYGVAMNTLEDVFVNISEREAAAAAAAAGTNVVDTATLNTETTLSGVPMETLFREAAEVNIISKLFFQTWAVYLKKFMGFFRSMRLIMSCIVIPVIMVGIGFGAAIPNFQNNYSNNNNNNYNWQDQYNGAVWPNDAHPHIVVYQHSDTWSPALEDLLNTFSAKYVEYETAIGRVNPTISIQKVTASQFSVGAFLGGGSISFLSTFNPLMQIGFHDDCVEQMVAPNMPNATYTLFYNDQNYNALYLVPFQALMGASVEDVWRRYNNDARPVALPVVIPVRVIPTLNITATPAPVTTTTVAPAHGPSSSSDGSDSHQPEFLLIPLGALINICIGQFAAGIILPVADELNRKVYHTLRLHGLSAMAYWAGTFIFDMTTGGSIIVAYIIGAFARGVTQIQNDIMVHQCLVILLTLSFAVMLAYSLALALPSDLKPSTYMYAIVGVYYLTLVIPLIIYVAYLSTNNFRTAPDWLQFMTPARCLLYAVMASPYPASSIWSENDTWRTYISLVMWNGAMALVILYKMYFGPRTFFRSNNNAQAPPPPPPQMQFPHGPPAPGQHPSAAYAVPMNAEGTVGMFVADPDVLAEENRIMNSPPTDNMAATVHLRKVYYGVATEGSANRSQSAMSSFLGAKCDKVAVNDLTLGIRSGECFGLLGPNGAGKTTTVKMMMRETQPTGGFVDFPYAPDAADVDGGCFGNIDGAYQAARLGVCQQGDTLWETFSAEEHLRLYLRIRLCGAYSGHELEQYIENTIRKVALEEAGTKQAGAYSGGMKRKLAVAIAMYTGARTVFLDEPSTGMDPYARRALWRSINEALQHDRCVLLTTHSMEEADAVCARIGIVTNGVLQCIGNSQHLKNRFGSGYSIVVTLHPRDANGTPVSVSAAEDSEAVAARQLMIESPQAVAATEAAGRAVDAYVMETFGKYQCELKEVLGLQRRYSIGRLPALSFAFRVLQDQQAALGISNYGVSQLSSLEQIFINFAGSTNNEGN
ncbi:ABC transporter, putative [Bodo saltans]|uniref:ABC transporter, putative n=1 Tax=Bodo saltans TaxID=75058 RepID=A0A0S4JQG5_BODSA|nr:ABC transporter, putative [Bodo saltans]|eukprot:CUG91546.1 ABC transporter, putative [Bodo saltans]